MATANDIEGLPPELLRRGRFDELFYVDLPTASEADGIFRVQLARRGCKLRDPEIAELANASCRRGFSGVDIEGAVKSGVEMAFERRIEARRRNDGSWDSMVVEKADFDEAMLLVKSTTETMGSKVQDLRERFEMFRLTPASATGRNAGRTSGRRS
jgi:SpoVK/Ycf46/Vps4 family AAA+-type ATPase